MEKERDKEEKENEKNKAEDRVKKKIFVFKGK